MGCCGSNIKDELFRDHRPIPITIIDKIKTSICKIKYTDKPEGITGTGFFLEYYSFYCLLTNYHVISENIKNIDIEIWNGKIIKLNLNDRNIKYLNDRKDITCIEIRENEINNITYLNIDLNYKRGYNQYLNVEVLALGYPNGNELSSGSGKIKGVGEYEFYHNIPTDTGSSGSPIILFSTLTVIGIHKAADHGKKLNLGTFIGEIIKDININENKNNKILNLNNINNKNNKNNEIICIYNKKDKEPINLLFNFNIQNLNN